MLESLLNGFNSGNRVQALDGMGEIGKTQTALEFAYRHRESYPFIFWVRANTRETLVEDYVSIAARLVLPTKDDKDQNQIVDAVKQWLASHPGWLLVLDNADDLIHTVDDFLPNTEYGHVLLTTCVRPQRSTAESWTLGIMTPEEGVRFLLHRISRKPADEKQGQAQAEALTILLGGLPLALDQAAAFIEETPSSFTEYQEIYDKERLALLQQRGTVVKGDHPESVAVTFRLAFEKVERASQAAADILRVCAFLNPDAIPESIFKGGAQELGEAIAATAAGSLKFTQALKEATRFSLLERNTDTDTLRLHRLLHMVLPIVNTKNRQI